jgi:hypothetical protein
MRNITFDVVSNKITNDDGGSNESIKITFTNHTLNSTIVKFKRGVYIEKIMLDSNSVTVSDNMNISPYFYLNDVKIETDKNYTYTTKSGSSGGGGTTTEIYVDNEDVLNQLSVIKTDLDGISSDLENLNVDVDLSTVYSKLDSIISDISKIPTTDYSSRFNTIDTNISKIPTKDYTSTLSEIKGLITDGTTIVSDILS